MERVEKEQLSQMQAIKQRTGKRFAKDVCKLRGGGDVLREEQIGFEAFVDKMTINLKVFGTLVKD